MFMEGVVMKNNNLLVRPGDKNVVLPNGIVMKTGSKSRRDVVFGTVIASYDSNEYPRGAKIFFPKYAADDIILDNEEYYDVHSDDVIMMVVK